MGAVGTLENTREARIRLFGQERKIQRMNDEQLYQGRSYGGGGGGGGLMVGAYIPIWLTLTNLSIIWIDFNSIIESIECPNQIVQFCITCTNHKIYNSSLQWHLDTWVPRSLENKWLDNVICAGMEIYSLISKGLVFIHPVYYKTLLHWMSKYKQWTI